MIVFVVHFISYFHGDCYGPVYLGSTVEIQSQFNNIC